MPSLPAASPAPRRPSLTPLGIALIYLVVASAWISASDALVAVLVGGDAGRMTAFQTAKGALFISLTAGMLYVLCARAQRAIRREQGVAQSVLAQLPEMVVVRDLEGRIVWINAAGIAMLGRPVSELVGRTMPEVTDAGLAAEIAAADARVLAERAPVFTERVMGRGEARRVYRTTRIALHDDDGEPLGIITVTRDVTARVRSDEALRAREAGLLQREKLEALGRLAGGVAHDFNNLLTVVGTAAELADDALATGPEGIAAARSDLEEVRRAAKRAGDLTRRLLSFARHHPAGRDRVDLAAVAADMATLVRRTVRAGVDVTVERDEGPHLVHGDATTLGQVVLNLLLNASDAMPEGGVVVVSTSVHEERRSDGRTRQWVSLRVRDDGVGMEEATRLLAVEPFFTTKPEGAGTGLGLATTDAIVREHGGRLHIESTPGEGTTVTVLLPPLKRGDVDASVGAVTRPISTPVPDAPTVLLVEDEAAVRTLARRALQRAGCMVVEARHGADALRLVDAGIAPQLVVTDVVMPEMNGVTLAERLRSRDATLPVLFISGYTAGESIPSMALSPGRTGFLQKPFGTDALVRAAMGLMEARGAER